MNEEYLEKTRLNGTVTYLHRYLMEQYIGRKLHPYELVHHINGNKYDNRIKNLLLSSRKKHPSQHRNREREKKASQLYLSGLSMTEVSKELNVVQGTIKKWLVERGIEPVSYKKRLLPKVIRLKAKKFTNKNIAKLIGLEEHTVGRWLKLIAHASTGRISRQIQ